MRSDNLQIDRTLALCGVCFGAPLLLVARSRSLPIGLPIVVVTSCLAYLFLSKTCFRDDSETRVDFSHRWPIVSNALFLILYSLSVINLDGSLYYRSIQYFVIIAILSALIGFDIMSTDYESSHSRTLLSLSKILLVSVNLELGRYSLFPSLVGDDPFKHSGWVQMTMESGRVPIGTQYSAFPGFHIEAATLGIVSALPTLKTTLFFTSGFLSIVSLLVIFKLAHVFLGVRGSLLATLFASSTTWLVQSRFEMLPYLTGLGLFPFIIYLTIAKDRLRLRGLVIAFLFGSLVITHTLSPAVTLFCMSIFFLGLRLVTPLREEQLRILLLATVMLVAYWFLASTFSVFVVQNLVETLTHATALAFPLHFLSWGESDLSMLGTYVIYWLAILGCLSYLSNRGRTPRRLSLVISVIGLLGVSYGFLVFLSSWAIVPDRWFPYALTLAVIPSSYAVLSLAKLGSRKSRVLLVCTLIVVVTFFSITSPLANDDSNFLTRPVTRFSVTSGELQSATFLNEVGNGVITTDFYYAENIFNQTLNHGQLGQDDLKEIETGMLDGSKPIDGMIIIRTSGFTVPVRLLTGGTYAKGAYSPYFYIAGTYDRSFLQELVSRGNVVYNSQSVIAIVIP